MDTLWEALITGAGWTARLSLQAGVVVLFILAAQALLRERLAPRWRYGLWLLMLLRLLLPWAPASQLSIYNLVSSAQEHLWRASAPAPVDVAPGVAQDPARPIQISPMNPPQQPSMPVAAPDTLNAERYETIRAWAPRLLAALWLAGVFFVAGSVLVQSRRLSVAIRRHRPLTEQWVLELLEDCKEELGLHTYLAVVETDAVAAPALFGFLRPCLLLPAGAAAALGSARLRHVFLHELTHLRRHDIAVGWLMAALQALHWFNPLLWYGFRQMRADRELACDEQVLERTGEGEPAEYGQTLIALLERFSHPRRAASLAGLLEDKDQMTRRIRMIARFHRGAAHWPLASILLMVLIGCTALTSAKAPRKVEPASVKLTIDPNGFQLRPYPEGGLYEMIASIRNVGNKPSPKFEVDFCRGAGFQPKTHGGGPLEPGAMQGNASMPFALREGENLLSVKIDPHHKLADSEKLTDSATLKVVVKDGKIVDEKPAAALSPVENSKAEGVKLTIAEPQGFTIEPYPEGGLYEMIASIRNVGNKPSPKFEVDFCRGAGFQPKTHGGGPLEPGAMQGNASMPFALQEGENLLSVKIDPHHKLADSEKLTDSATLMVIVKDGKIVDEKPAAALSPAENPKAEGVKLTIAEPQGFTIEPYPEGGLYSLVVSIRNTGTEPSPAFDVNFYRGEDSKPMTHGAGPIKPGGVWNEASMPFALKEGTNRLSVILDPDHKLPAAAKLTDRATMKVVVKNGKIVESGPLSGAAD